MKSVLKTGNLPESLLSTVIEYDSKKSFDQKPLDGFRFSHVGYKVSKLQKAEDKKLNGMLEVPKSFAVQVPVVAFAVEETETELPGDF